MQPKVSVIIPAYNVEKCIEKCVNSILDQSFSDFEILLVDDGSKDSTPKICDELANKDSRITVIHKENGGLSDARNAGIRKSVGKYLAFVDGDDISDFNRNKYYELFSAVFQDFSILDVTIAEEIAQCKDNIDYQRIKECIDYAGLIMMCFQDLFS